MVLKEIQRYHGPGLWAWRKNFFTPERHQFYNNTLSHIFGAIPWQVSQRLLLWTFWGWTAQEVLNPPFLTSKSYDEHFSPFLTRRSQKRSIFSVFVQAWNIQLCLDKLSCFIIYSYGKSVLSSTYFNLNAWESYTNDIKQDLVENKYWLNVICTCRNIHTVNWRYGHTLACFTLEQIRKSWIP